MSHGLSPCRPIPARRGGTARFGQIDGRKQPGSFGAHVTRRTSTGYDERPLAVATPSHRRPELGADAQGGPDRAVCCAPVAHSRACTYARYGAFVLAARRPDSVAGGVPRPALTARRAPHDCRRQSLCHEAASATIYGHPSISATAAKPMVHTSSAPTCGRLQNPGCSLRPTNSRTDACRPRCRS